jgi:hypothetical protein
MSRIRAWPIFGVAAALLLGFLATPRVLPAQPSAPTAKYGYIYLKDGFVLRGFIKQEGTTILDRTGDRPQLEWIPSGFCFIDDGARRIIFPPQIQDIQVQ